MIRCQGKLSTTSDKVSLDSAAVCGLPEPQEDHALRMTKFASECLHKMDSLVVGLVDSLGQETADLKLRVGIHSGPTTAGVLRGQKSRFQLFGDTVNTAARMESNGSPGAIHISQATADLLMNKHGKKHWIKKREGGSIQVKGKGQMQTYWVMHHQNNHGNSNQPNEQR